jgi:4-amino-4-deoxy-L-arabinose transferase-like glycosyltransferase
MYALAARLFGRLSLSLLASGLLALAPLHMIAGRLALASVYPVAFILAWLLGFTAFLRDKRPALLFASTLSLGVGVYAHPTSTLMMPILFGLTILTLWGRDRSALSLGIAAAGFGLPLAVLVPWFYFHYDVFRFTLGDWGLHTLANPRDGLRYSLLNWPALATRSTVYWGYFSPSFLFFTGGAELVTSTERAGAFLGLTAIPLFFGIYAIVTDRWSDPAWRLMLLAFALAPIAGSTFNEPKAAGRVLGMLPLGVLIAVTGIDVMAHDRRRLVRWAAVAVVCLLPIQFARFYSDYFTNYPQRSAAAFGQGAVRP